MEKQKRNLKNKKEMKNMKNKLMKKNKSPHLFTLNKIVKSDRLVDSPELLRYNKEFSPLSGSEPVYNEKKWNDNENIRTTHNCYSYALGKIRSGLESKAQPGYASGFNYVNDNEYNCKNFYERLKKDVPGSYLETFDNACHPGFYKIFLMLDVGNDYHWARQDNNLYWSHKPGSTNVTNKDAKGNQIKNPLSSSWKYESLNYDKPCFFACIYSDLSKSISKIYSE
jgi:hypothetical protein